MIKKKIVVTGPGTEQNDNLTDAQEVLYNEDYKQADQASENEKKEDKQ
ncbi:hypothetical protein JOC78_000718 [Bacillus ectoiniformans]|nr:YfhE family protein [Bacillus ectoiniformans]MBM7647778.1 hypothetical protein [Bacillus ectoiniformans]